MGMDVRVIREKYNQIMTVEDELRILFVLSRTRKLMYGTTPGDFTLPKDHRALFHCGLLQVILDVFRGKQFNKSLFTELIALSKHLKDQFSAELDVQSYYIKIRSSLKLVTSLMAGRAAVLTDLHTTLELARRLYVCRHTVALSHHERVKVAQHASVRKDKVG